MRPRFLSLTLTALLIAPAAVLPPARAATEPTKNAPEFSPATLIYKATLSFPPGSARLSPKGVKTVRDIVRRVESVQLPRIRVTVDGGDEVWHVSSVRLRKSQGDAIVRELQRVGVKGIPVDVEGVNPNHPELIPRNRRTRTGQRETTVAIWDIRGG